MAFLALVVFGLGMASLVTASDVIATPGLGVLPGVLGVVAAGAALVGVLLPALRAGHPSYVTALWAALASYLAYLSGVWLSAVVGGVDPAVAAGVVGRLAIGWWAPVVAAAAFVCAWSAVALRRTRARRPRWPWERDADR
ncbi:MAG: hypothetical protein QM602_06860 [Microbacterium sp.]